jgi:membrane protease subunit (stomatin/prohibitin family)
MGFIQAFVGALGGTLADNWIDFLTVPSGITPTAAIFPAVPVGRNNGRGENTKGSVNIISNGSKIVVPEGYGLVTVEDGKVTGFIAEAGGYIWNTTDQNSQSIFAGDGIVSPLIKTTWERFKRGGQPGSQQLAFYVNLKEIPNNRFGTQSEIYWDDAYLNTQVGAITRGSYTLRIIDPILFIANFVPATYISNGAPVFDFSDMSNPVGEQLFNEVVSSLAPAFSAYTNDPDKGNRMSRIQGDSLGFAQSLAGAVEEGYRWTSDRGLTIVKTAIVSIEYDERTRNLLTDVQKADALSGNRSGSFLNQSIARGMEAAGENGGAGGLFGMGLAGGAIGGLVQPTAPGPNGIPTPQAPVAPQAPAAPVPAEDPVAKLTQFKQMLDAGLISQEEFEAAKAKLLGL